MGKLNVVFYFVVSVVNNVYREVIWCDVSIIATMHPYLIDNKNFFLFFDEFQIKFEGTFMWISLISLFDGHVFIAIVFICEMHEKHANAMFSLFSINQ